VKVPKKWRPSLGFLIASVVGFLVVLPFFALVAARVTSNQFVRETEANLHSQAAIYATMYAEIFERLDPNPRFGSLISEEASQRLLKNFHPIDPDLVASSNAILPPRPDPVPNVGAIDALYIPVREALSTVAINAKKTTLVGLLALDHQGSIVAKSGGDDGNLMHVDEVARALSGEIVSVARWREEQYNSHSIRSISRDTKFRVFVVHPVIVADRVVGAVYLSRTPSNLNKYLFQQRNTFGWLFAALGLSALLVGLFLWRFLTKPLRGLAEQASSIAHGATGERLPNYGVKEIASLGQSVMDMGASLRTRSEALESYTKHATHELKSPVTAIMGAAELLQNDQVSEDRRQALAGTISTEVARMDQLLVRMREMVRGQLAFASEPVTLEQAVEEAEAAFPKLTLSARGDMETALPIGKEALRICLKHLLENAEEHRAAEVVLDYDSTTQILLIEDDGQGLSEANVDKALEPFFTTKRSEGGTGLGLAICSDIVAQFEGELRIENGGKGARVMVEFNRE